MIYVFGELPQWLINIIKELGEDTVRIHDCGVPPRNIVISISNACTTKGSIVLSLLPYENAIPIQRSTARGILSTVISLLKRVGDAKCIEDALLLLGFTKTDIINAMGMTEITVNNQVVPGSIYTIIAINKHQNRYMVTLGRGTARGTLILDTSISWLLSNGNDIYAAKGDLMLELMALSMIFSINFIHPNTPHQVNG